MPEFIPFLDYDVETRRVICSANAIESINAHYLRAIRVRGHFPTEQAVMNASTWSHAAAVRHDEQYAGSQRSTRSRSPSTARSPDQPLTNATAGCTVNSKFARHTAVYTPPPIVVQAGWANSPPSPKIV
jgi:hypothetical protein